MEDESKLISVLRHFNWDQSKLEERWFDNEKYPVEIGIEFDEDSLKFHPEMN